MTGRIVFAKVRRLDPDKLRKAEAEFYVNVNEENPGPILWCGAHTLVLYCDGDFNWLGQVLGGGGRFDPSLAVR
jgi:hypothetical protein